MSQTLIAGPAANPLSGSLTPPGDKSISHRVIMLAALSEGVTEVGGFLPGEDNLATARMFSDMGVTIKWLDKEKTELRIHGAGLHGLKEPVRILDAGNSGTCARLMLGILAGQSFFSVMAGDDSLCTRPMLRVVEPLRRMGALLEGRQHGQYLPLAVRGGGLKAIHHVSEVASAQVKSCVMLASLFADGEVYIEEPAPSRDHTERMFPLFGQAVDLEQGLICIRPAGGLTAPGKAIEIPADASSSSFFAVAASIIDGSDIHLRHVGINPRRDGWRRIMTQMGAGLGAENEYMLGEEPVADLAIAHSRLHGIQVNVEDVADTIDEFPILFVAAALAEGTFELEGAEELRVKESDRITSMAAALSACGVEIEEHPGGIHITGRERFKGGMHVDAKNDHRIAMAMAVAAQKADADIEIRNAGAIATSFPDFVPMAHAIGMNIRWAT